MDPFETPPTTPLVSTDPPSGPRTTPRRGRMALVALVSAGLLAGGVVGVSALATADDPELGTDAVAASDDPEPSPTSDTDDEIPDEGSGGGVAESATGGAPGSDVEASFDLDADEIARLQECLGLPMLPFEEWTAGGDVPLEFEFEFDGDLAAELEALFDEFVVILDEFEPGEFGPPRPEGTFGDGQVTVAGPDGVTVIDLGDGDASVTITRDGQTGELSITTQGTATEAPLDELIGSFLDELGTEVPLIVDEFGEFEQISPEALEQFLAELPDLEQLITEFDAMFDEFDLGGYEESRPDVEFGDEEFGERFDEMFEEMFGELDGFFEDGMFPGFLDVDALDDCLADLG